ncbi:hypothetical protein [Streptomyces sp900116325]|uniref:hypothetical protein n=1 Tax=Streptomyces sp. 900116325 TaxID=3154295 RepID=UPI00339DE88D
MDQLRDLVTRESNLGDVVLRACLGRRALLVGQGAGFRIIGSRYSPDTRPLREFAARNRLPHRWSDLEADEEAEALLRRFAVGPEQTPLVIWRDTTLSRPDRQGTSPLDQPLEDRPQRLRHHLRRPTQRSTPLTSTTPVTPLIGQSPGTDQGAATRTSKLWRRR